MELTSLKVDRLTMHYKQQQFPLKRRQCNYYHRTEQQYKILYPNQWNGESKNQSTPEESESETEITPNTVINRYRVRPNPQSSLYILPSTKNPSTPPSKTPHITTIRFSHPSSSPSSLTTLLSSREAWSRKHKTIKEKNERSKKKKKSEKKNQPNFFSTQSTSDQ